MEKQRKKVLNKLSVFFEQIRKSFYIKVNGNLPYTMKEEIAKKEYDFIKSMKGKNIKLSIGLDRDDLSKNLETFLFKFNHSKLDKRL